MQLYKKTNQDYVHNGDFSLTNVIQAVMRMVVRGEWCIEIEVPQFEEYSKYFEHDAVVKIENPREGEELWVVTYPKRTDFGSLTAKLYPKALWDAQNDLILRDCRPTGMTGQEALMHMLTSAGGYGKYKVESDIVYKTTAYYQNKNIIEAICGSDENSFVNRWGGQPYFTNDTIKVNLICGRDDGIRM